jgi:hypothetical protein
MRYHPLITGRFEQIELPTWRESEEFGRRHWVCQTASCAIGRGILSMGHRRARGGPAHGRDAARAADRAELFPPVRRLQSRYSSRPWEGRTSAISCSRNRGAIGNSDGNHRMDGHWGGLCELHNPSYDFNDASISLRGSVCVRVAETWLSV